MQNFWLLHLWPLHSDTPGTCFTQSPLKRDEECGL